MSQHILNGITSQQELENWFKNTKSHKEKWALLIHIRELKNQLLNEWLERIIANEKNTKTLRTLVTHAISLDNNGLTGEVFRRIIENRNEHWKLRKLAVDALFHSKYMHPEFGETLSQVAADKNDHWEVRYVAIERLGESEYTESLDLLASLLLDQNEPNEIRENAAYALGVMDASAAYEPLVRAMQDPAASVRRWTVNALGHLGDQRAVPLVKEVLRTDTDDSVREAAIHALSDLKVTDDLEIFEEAIKDRSWYVRWNTIYWLSYIEDEKVPAIIATALKDRSKKVREWAAKCLKGIQEAA
jgi:HEAT repeats